LLSCPLSPGPLLWVPVVLTAIPHCDTSRPSLVVLQWPVSYRLLPMVAEGLWE
ncbi:Hypothetical predicted protein, partial [Marmota monax]